MRAADQLSEFIREALASGRDSAAVEAALTSAGWSASEIQEAMGAWVAVPGLPPIPRPRPYVSAREALLYGLLFLSLGMIAWHIGTMGFELIDRMLPDAGGSSPYRDDSGLRWSVAALVTFGPLFFLLNARTNRATRGDPGRRRSLVRKWFASITLLIAALTLLGDLVLVIYTLLDGALTARYLTKTVLVAVLGALVFLYYRDELDA